MTRQEYVNDSGDKIFLHDSHCPFLAFYSYLFRLGRLLSILITRSPSDICHNVHVRV